MKCDRRWYNDGRVRREAEALERERNPVWVDFYAEHPQFRMRITLPPGPNGFDPLLEAL